MYVMYVQMFCQLSPCNIKMQIEPKQSEREFKT